MKFSLRSILGRKNNPSGNPIEADKQTRGLMEWLDIIKTNDSFEQWREQFLGRYRGYVGEVGCDRASKAYEGFRGKVDRLVHAVEILVESFHEKNKASHKKIAAKSKPVINQVVKNSQIVNTQLFGLAPTTTAEEEISGYNKFHMAYILIRDDFLEYERLNLCKDVITHLRNLVLDDVADRAVLAAMDDYSRAVNRFLSLIQDLGVIQVINKSRELKRVKVPNQLPLSFERGGGDTSKTTELLTELARWESSNNAASTDPLSVSERQESTTVIHVADTPKARGLFKLKKPESIVVPSRPEDANTKAQDTPESRPASERSKKPDSESSLYLEDENDKKPRIKKPLSLRPKSTKDIPSGRKEKSLPVRPQSAKDMTDIRHGKLRKRMNGPTGGTDVTLLVVSEEDGESVASGDDNDHPPTDPAKSTSDTHEGSDAVNPERKKKKNLASKIHGDDDDSRTVVSISSKKKAKLKSVQAAKGKKNMKSAIKEKKELMRLRVKPSPESETTMVVAPADSANEYPDLPLTASETDNDDSVLPPPSPLRGDPQESGEEVVDPTKTPKPIQDDTNSENPAPPNQTGSIERKSPKPQNPLSPKKALGGKLVNPLSPRKDLRGKQVNPLSPGKMVGTKALRSKVGEKRTPSSSMSLSGPPRKLSSKPVVKDYVGALLDASDTTDDRQDDDLILNRGSTPKVTQPQKAVVRKSPTGSNVEEANRQLGTQSEHIKGPKSFRSSAPWKTDIASDVPREKESTIRSNVKQANRDLSTQSEPMVRPKSSRDIAPRKTDVISQVPSKNEETAGGGDEQRKRELSTQSEHVKKLPSVRRVASFTKYTQQNAIGQNLDRSARVERNADVSKSSSGVTEKIVPPASSTTPPARSRMQKKMRETLLDRFPSETMTPAITPSSSSPTGSPKELARGKRPAEGTPSLTIKIPVKRGERELDDQSLEQSGMASDDELAAKEVSASRSRSSFPNSIKKGTSQIRGRGTNVDGQRPDVASGSSGPMRPYSVTLLALEDIASDSGSDDQHGLFLDESGHTSRYASLDGSNDLTGMTDDDDRREKASASASLTARKKKYNMVSKNNDKASAFKPKSLRKKGDLTGEKTIVKVSKKPKAKNANQKLTGWVNTFEVGGGEHHYEVTCYSDSDG